MSSHMPPQAMPPMPHPSNPTPTPTTPSIGQTHTPPRPAPSTPSATSLMQGSPATPTTSISASTPPPAVESRASIPAPPTPVAKKVPFYPPLPWLSVPGEPFPPRIPQRRRKLRHAADPDAALQLPAMPQADVDIAAEEEVEPPMDGGETTEEQTESQTSTVAARSDIETPATSLAPSETDSSIPATPPQSAVPPSSSRPTTSSVHLRTPTKPVLPVLPVTPKVAGTKAQIPTPPKFDSKDDTVEPSSIQSPPSDTTQSTVTGAQPPASEADDSVPTAPAATVPRPKQKSWAEVARPNTANIPLTTINPDADNANDGNNSINAGSLAEALRAFSLTSASRIPFLEPRGLVNTGNMCYMNSVRAPVFDGSASC